MKGNTTARSHSRGWHWKMWSLLLSSPSLPCSLIPQHSLSALTRSQPPPSHRLAEKVSPQLGPGSWCLPVLEGTGTKVWQGQEQRNKQHSGRAGEIPRREHTGVVPPSTTHLGDQNTKMIKICMKESFNQKKTNGSAGCHFLWVQNSFSKASWILFWAAWSQQPCLSKAWSRGPPEILPTSISPLLTSISWYILKYN